MEKNIKVRVIVGYNDLIEKQYFPSCTIRYIDYQRARELEKKGIIAIMEIRKCKYE